MYVGYTTLSGLLQELTEKDLIYVFIKNLRA